MPWKPICQLWERQGEDDLFPDKDHAEALGEIPECGTCFIHAVAEMVPLNRDILCAGESEQ